MRLARRQSWRLRLKRKVTEPNRFYGDGTTIHSTGYLDVETHVGTVVAVWYRCQMLPFQQTEVDGRRATEMESATELPGIAGLELTEHYLRKTR